MLRLTLPSLLTQLPTPDAPEQIPVWFWSVAFAAVAALLGLTVLALFAIARSAVARVFDRLGAIEQGISAIGAQVGGAAKELSDVKARVELLERSIPLRLRRAAAGGPNGEG